MMDNPEFPLPSASLSNGATDHYFSDALDQLSGNLSISTDEPAEPEPDAGPQILPSTPTDYVADPLFLPDTALPELRTSFSLTPSENTDGPHGAYTLLPRGDAGGAPDLYSFGRRPPFPVPPDPVADYDRFFSSDDKATVQVMQHLSRITGLPPSEFADNHEPLRDHVMLEEHGVLPSSDAEFLKITNEAAAAKKTAAINDFGADVVLDAYQGTSRPLLDLIQKNKTEHPGAFEDEASMIQDLTVFGAQIRQDITPDLEDAKLQFATLGAYTGRTTGNQDRLTAGATGDVMDGLVENLARLPDDQRHQRMQMIALAMARLPTPPKDTLEQVGEALDRSIGNIGSGLAAIRGNPRLDAVKGELKTGPRIYLRHGESTWNDVQIIEDRQRRDDVLDPEAADPGGRYATPEEIADLSHQTEFEDKKATVRRELASPSQHVLDPQKTPDTGVMGAFETVAISAASLAPYLIVSAVPIAGELAVAASFAGNEKDRILLADPHADPEATFLRSIAVGSGLGLINRLRFGLVLGKLPLSGAFLEGLTKSSPWLIRTTTKAAAAAAETGAQAEAQLLVRPVVDGLATALGVDTGFDLHHEFTAFRDAQNLETVLTNLPVLLVGMGAISYHGYRGFKEMTDNSRLLQFYGMPEPIANRIAAEPNLGKRQVLLMEAYPSMRENLPALIKASDQAVDQTHALLASPDAPALRAVTGKDSKGNPVTEWHILDASGKSVYQTSNYQAALKAFGHQWNVEGRTSLGDELPVEKSKFSPEGAKWKPDADTPVIPAEKRFLNFRDAEEFVQDQLSGRPLEIPQLGISASISKRSAGKIVNDSSVGKSSSVVAHLAAVNRIPELLKVATPISHADRNKDPNIAAMHRLYSIMEFNKKFYVVKITVKEYSHKSNGNRLYALEVVETTMPPKLEISGK